MALLSRMSDQQVAKICRHINYYESDSGGRLDTEAVIKELKWVKHVGYCYREHCPDPNISSLAFPMNQTLYGIPLALGVGGHHDRIARNKVEITETVREVITDFSNHHDHDDDNLAMIN